MSADTATNVNSTSTIQIPVTIANLKTGVQRETYLTAASFGLTTTNVAIGTGVTTLGKYTVQAQEALKLGHKTASNSLMYVSLAYT